MAKQAQPNPGKPETPDEYTQWQAEESARHNAMADAARKMGFVIPTGCGHPPQLNPDGSLAQSPGK